jgi:predicted nucleic acid-binding protein
MGPLHYLVLIGCDHILPVIFDRIISARVVIELEMADPHTPEAVRRWAINPPAWLEILEPKLLEDIPALGKQGVRGDGDRAIISLARQERADVVIMEDAKARREVQKRGFKPIWTLEVLDLAAERGVINDIGDRLEQLVYRTTFYVGEKARAVIEEMKRRDAQRKQGHAKRPSAPERSHE